MTTNIISRLSTYCFTAEESDPHSSHKFPISVVFYSFLIFSSSVSSGRAISALFVDIATTCVALPLQHQHPPLLPFPKLSHFKSSTSQSSEIDTARISNMNPYFKPMLRPTQAPIPDQAPPLLDVSKFSPLRSPPMCPPCPGKRKTLQPSSG